MHLSALYLYPVKSLGGYAVTEAEVTSRGLRHDRRWLLVDERNRFLTQRQHPDMALLALAPAYNGFLLTHRQRPDLLPLYVSFAATSDRTVFVSIWDDLVWAWRGAPEADEWLSVALGRAGASGVHVRHGPPPRRASPQPRRCLGEFRRWLPLPAAGRSRPGRPQHPPARPRCRPTDSGPTSCLRAARLMPTTTGRTFKSGTYLFEPCAAAAVA